MHKLLINLIFAIFLCLLCPAQPPDLRNITNIDSHTHFTLAPARNLEQWSLRKTHLRRQVLAAAGLYPLPFRPPLNVQRLKKIERHKYIIETVVIETFPGFFLAGNLYYPLHSKSRRLPAVLVPHGHWKHGRIHHAPDYSVPALCINLAAQGYVAFAYDMVGYNDTSQTPHDFGDSQTEQLWSFHPLGLQLWNSMKALDYLASLDNVDPLRIAVTGASGGATQTILLAAVDPRVRAAAPVNMVSSTFQGDDACEMAPGLRVNTNNVEIAAMIAPRPMLLVSSSKDWTKQTPRLEFPAIRSFYRLFGTPGHLSSVQIDAGHNYNQQSREAVYRFLRTYLQNGTGDANPKEVELVDFNPKDLLLGAEPVRQMDKVLAGWRQLTHLSVEQFTGLQLEDALQAITGTEWPDQVNTVTAGERLFLERPGHGELVPVSWISGAGSEVTVIVHPDGVEAARKSPQVALASARGDSIVLLDPYHRPPATPTSRGKDFLTYHQSDDSYRVQDILTGMAYATSLEGTNNRLVCIGKARAWCLMAASLSQTYFEFNDDPEELTGTDDELRKSLFIPGLQRAGGLLAARSLLRGKRLQFTASAGN